ncbi:hypothetical protein [Mesorhizobium sp. M1143]
MAPVQYRNQPLNLPTQ